MRQAGGGTIQPGAQTDSHSDAPADLDGRTDERAGRRGAKQQRAAASVLWAAERSTARLRARRPDATTTTASADTKLRLKSRRIASQTWAELCARAAGGDGSGGEGSDTKTKKGQCVAPLLSQPTDFFDAPNLSTSSSPRARQRGPPASELVIVRSAAPLLSALRHARWGPKRASQLATSNRRRRWQTDLRLERMITCAPVMRSARRRNLFAYSLGGQISKVSRTTQQE